MGGFHETEAHYTKTNTLTNNGYITISAGDIILSVKEFDLSPSVIDAFKRELVDDWYEYGRILCYDTSRTDSRKNTYKTVLMSDSRNIYDQMTMLSLTADIDRLPMDKCKK